MDAIVVAGGIPEPGDPLYPLTQGKPKALLELAGKPMAQWVLDALDASHSVGQVVLIGLEPDSGLTLSKPITYIPNQGGMVENLIAGVKKLREINPESQKVLAASSDIPGITGEMVDWLIDDVNKSDKDAYYTIVTREVMEARYPGSNRSYTKLKGLEVCGGDLNVLAVRLVDRESEIWDKLTEARKSVLKQASLIGYGTLILLLFRQLTMDSAVNRVTKRLGITGQAVVSPYAELAMDVDKPHQLEIVSRDLEVKAEA
jgi:GTP:adenosylcobinamide-phosphate guanylyltransferase